MVFDKFGQGQVHKKVGSDNAPAGLEHTTVNAMSAREAFMAIYCKCKLYGPDNEGCLMQPHQESPDALTVNSENLAFSCHK